MLTVDDYGRIRRAHQDGMSVRAIARTFHHSWRKVREALESPEPQPYTRSKDPPAPKLGPYHAVIDGILQDDEQAPRKQRHNRMQIFRRLRDELGYGGRYDQVRRYVNQKRHDQRETFIPLAHDPGQRMECDFGHIYVDFPEGRRQVPVFIAVWAYSYAPFIMPMPTERTEAILSGMVGAFEFFGCVPREVWWDNPTTVVARIFKGRVRQPHPRYAALASHYTFEPLFCLPAHGNEKPHVENRVYDVQRRFATPVPMVKDMAELNAYFRTCCLKERDRTVSGQTETIGVRLQQDQSKARALPAHPFDPCIHQAALVDKYQTVCFDGNRYSVPRTWAHTSVTVKAYVEEIHVVAQGQIIARHRRSYQRRQQLLDPLHYLVTLGRRPATLDHARVFRDWRLPGDFAELRSALEQHHGPATGARHYIRVLQLLGQHPVNRVQAAIQQCAATGPPAADRIFQRVFRLAQRPTESLIPEAIDPVLAFEIPKPDLRQFDQLLTQGECAYV